jgi:hypothetical protein
MASQLQQRGNAVWFLTEQACCLMLAQGEETDDFGACRAAVEYLAGDDREAVTEFLERTGLAPGNPGGLAADYDLEEYREKDRDLAGALYDLLTRGHDCSVPEPTRASLLKGTQLVASFYGADGVFNA